MTTEQYYTAPPQKVFEEIKKAAIDIWHTYDNTYGYVDEKMRKIERMANIKDNAWTIVAMFDHKNIVKLLNKVSFETAQMIQDAMNTN